MANKEDKNIAQSIGLYQVSTQEAIDELAFDMLYTLYRANPQPHAKQLAQFNEKYKPETVKKLNLEAFTDEALNNKVKEVFQQWTGSEWYDDNDKVNAMLLLGPPGQGKTTSFKEAAKKISKAMGLQFKLNPSDDQEILPSDFLFISMEFSGENQTTTMGGIPAKTVDEATGVEYMTKLVNKRLALARRAGAALLLLDDFPNAAPSVQNVGLSITDEKRFQGLNLDNVYVGLTGNLGAVDGTHTTRLSTALRGRCKVYYTEDMFENWINRAQQKYKDEVGDVGLSGFMKTYSDHFAEMPNTRQSGGFPSPRTWDHFLQDLRRVVARYNGRSEAVEKINGIAVSYLGPEVGGKVQSYLSDWLSGPAPMARQIIIDGNINTKELAKMKDSSTQKGSLTLTQFGYALGDTAAQAIYASKNTDPNPAKNPKFKEVIERFAQGVAAMSDEPLVSGITHFKQKLANSMGEGWVKETFSGKTLSNDVEKAIEKIIGDIKDIEAEKRNTIIDVFKNGIDNTSRHRRRMS